VFATNLRGNGKDAWFGWPSDEKMEALRNAWRDATEDADRKKSRRKKYFSANFGNWRYRQPIMAAPADVWLGSGTCVVPLGS
jgi:hypothetical protein